MLYGLADVIVLPSTFTPYLLQGKFLTTIISWLQQVVEMSIIHGPTYIPLSVVVKEKLLYAIEVVVNLNIILVNVIFIVILECKWFCGNVERGCVMVYC